jgi:hypothetical protein
MPHKGKNMKKHFIKHSLLTVLILVNVTFTGCFPTGKTSTNELANTAADINSDGGFSSSEAVPKHLNEELLDKLEINADINFPADAKWKTYSATLKNFSEEELNTAFLNEKTIKDKYEYQLYEDRDDVTTTYNFSDDTSLNVQAGMAIYSHPEYDHRYMLADDDLSNFIRPDIADLYTETSLDGIDRAQSVDLVKGKLSALGVSVSDTPEVYALNYDTFKNLWENYEEKDGTPAKPWDKDDEAYLIIFKEQAETLPITDEGYINAENGLSTNGGRIYGLVSKSGLIYLSLAGIYEISEPSNNVNLISFNTRSCISRIISVVRRNHHQIIFMHGINDFRNTCIEFFQRISIAFRITTMTKHRIEVHKVCETHSFVKFCIIQCFNQTIDTRHIVFGMTLVVVNSLTVKNIVDFTNCISFHICIV